MPSMSNLSLFPAPGERVEGVFAKKGEGREGTVNQFPV